MKNCLILLLFVSQLGLAQLTVKKVNSIAFAKEKLVGIDKFDNLYYQQKNALFKLEPTKKEYTFFDPQLGELTSVDLINPLQITLFYQDMNTVVILDNRLNEIKRINFSQIEDFKIISFAGTAKNNSLWLYNKNLEQLELFDTKNLKTIARTQPFDSEIYDLTSNLNFVWIAHQKALELYNIYGNMVKSWQPKKVENLMISDNFLLAKTGNSIEISSTETENWKNVYNSEIEVKDIFLQQENLYLYTQNFLSKYQINLPKE
ncbi:hypothetical protein [Mesonia sp. K7]|uniref:hypothetical protein n=1 Tax=Mesonia sp. K7 TaxID=2218606 RepID=UPI000DA73AFE|nr:hypothetical protein [Mesonia sp. K7]PZD78631.1 hypothetical protein DNG35_04010 [Mesonia sp. K7]